MTGLGNSIDSLDSSSSSSSSTFRSTTAALSRILRGEKFQRVAFPPPSHLRRKWKEKEIISMIGRNFSLASRELDRSLDRGTRRHVVVENCRAAALSSPPRASVSRYPLARQQRDDGFDIGNNNNNNADYLSRAARISKVKPRIR